MSGHAMPARDRTNPPASKWFVAPRPSRLVSHRAPMSAFLPPPASSFLARFVAGRSNEYAGHYVLIAGMDAARDAYVVMDPARDDAEVSVPRADVDAARRSWGTDEDLIVVPRGQ